VHRTEAAARHPCRSERGRGGGWASGRAAAEGFSPDAAARHPKFRFPVGGHVSPVRSANPKTNKKNSHFLAFFGLTPIEHADPTTFEKSTFLGRCARFAGAHPTNAPAKAGPKYRGLAKGDLRW